MGRFGRRIKYPWWLDLWDFK